MPRTDNLYALPPDLPVPEDDGACDHLPGLRLPSIPLPSTAGREIDLSRLPGRTVVYLYPHTGRPDRNPLPGWNEIPGARGCTPQSCAFRDHHAELRELGAEAVFGLSTQDTDYQREAVERLHLPYELLSDERFEWIGALSLPTFELAENRFVKRITLIVRDGVIERVFYPVFPPDGNAEEVASWLRDHPLGPSDTHPSVLPRSGA